MSRRKAVAETVATVNLLSPWVFEELRVRRLRRRFVIGAVALVVLVALAWTGQRLNLHQANEELRGEDAVTVGLSRQISELTPVRTYVGGVEHRVQVVRGATYDDIAFSDVLDALRDATPDGADLGTISVELPDGTIDAAEPPAGGDTDSDPARGLLNADCPGPDPFGTKVVIGCVTLEGTAVDRETVGRLVIALGDASLFVEPFVSTTTTSDSQEVAFSGSVGLSPKAFSRRYESIGADLTKEKTP